MSEQLPTPQYADLRDWKQTALWLRGIAEHADEIPPHGDDIAITMHGCGHTLDLCNQWLWPETRSEILAIAKDVRDLQQRCEELSKKWKASFDANARLTLRNHELTQQKAAVLNLCEYWRDLTDATDVTPQMLAWKICALLAPPCSDAEQEKPADG